MSKKISSKLVLPESHVSDFWDVVKSMATYYGIEKVKDVHHYVQLLGQAVERHSDEAVGRPSPKYRKERERKRFIKIFKTRYLHLTDLEYHRVTGIDTKMIDHTLDAIQDKGLDVDEYLKWVFEIFLVDNPKFCPANIKQTCSKFFLERFLYENREKIRKRNQDSVRKKEVMDLVARGRVLIREAKDSAAKEAVKDVLKDYRDDKIGLVEFRKKIDDMEQKED